MRLTPGTQAGAILAATALLAAGCSAGADSADGPGDAPDPTGPVELTFWTWAPNIEKVVDLWNADNPDIQVVVNKQDGGDPAVTKLLTAIEAGSGAPDIMQAEYQKIPQLVSNDAVADISGQLSDDTPGHFADGVWNAVTLGTDAVYAVPQDSGPMQFYYRADIFEKYNLDVPATWDEYAEVAMMLHEQDPDKYLGTFSANDAGWFVGLTQQAGASWYGIEGDAWAVDIDSPEVTRVAEYWGGLVEDGVIDNKPMYTPEWNQGLNDGTQVGWLSAIWAPGVLEGNAPDTAGKWEMAPMPQWDENAEATGAWGGSATAVTSQSEHPEQAAKFIEWMNTDPVAVQALVDESGLYPADIPGSEDALAEPPAFFSNQENFYEIAAQTAQTTQPFTYGPNINVAYSAYNDEFAKATEARSADAFVAAVEAMQQVTVDDLTNSGFDVAE
ncbi:ABC transporter substrate-binding protein [Myceligenerans xiligouense]|uniref:Carbohydrate ABC transporter substrate-binding protein (CUT1 family) n=1 Tax=Myceligenerans xiligouense TaxID=253184 RepID=A0A3N4YMV2_9MICO|nr:extracellular solute-binding protein [Myceligenerans xiligouense]RPF20654.1 carbohydrate ABC transporter substrate-binding protein (CUT1 family) [Myceligenerans xiligouense]